MPTLNIQTFLLGWQLTNITGLQQVIPAHISSPVMATKGRSLTFLWLPSFFLFISTSYSEGDTLRQGDSLIDWEHLVSANGNFAWVSSALALHTSTIQEYGTPNMIKKKVWVANRNNPIADSSGNLTIDGEGKLKLNFNGGSIRLPFFRMMAILY